MRAALGWALLCCASAAHGEPALGGGSGLLTVPDARVQAEGTATFQFSRIYPDLARTEQTDAWYAGVGFAPGLELGGRAIATALRAGRRDLSLDAKYQLPWEVAGVRVAVGAHDLGGVERLLPREYAVATWSSAPLDVTLGYGRGRNVLDGPFGGVAWRPWPLLTLVAEHDAEDLNGGLKLAAPELAGWRASGSASWRGALEETEYALQLEFPLGREHAREAPAIASRDAVVVPRGTVRDRLLALGFEAVQVGRRDGGVLVVRLENRRYNHAAGDGIGLALGTIAALAPDDVDRIELFLCAYGVPLLRVAASRNWIADLAVEPVDEVPDAAWEQALETAHALELVVEPVLRTAVATEHGLLDYGLGLRARVTAPLAGGLLASVGAQAPVARSDDFGEGRPFQPLAPKGGIDLGLLQYLHSPQPGWTLLWSAGRAQVFRAGVETAALDQAWRSRSGAHRLRSKLMWLQGDAGTREVALAGYDWLDAARAYGVGLTAGRFYAGDAGARLDVERHFGDTIFGLFYKFAGRDDQAIGATVSLPLTPRRDPRPSWIQLKGPRRWAHALGTTLDGPPSDTSPDGTNPIRPLLLHEPLLELDLERDVLDAGRLGEDWLREELPRLYDAFATWGGSD